MIAVTEIAFTGYPVTDMARARAFYEGHFGLKPTSVLEFPGGAAFTEYEIGPGAFCLAKMDDWTPTHQGPCCAFEVADFDTAMTSLKAGGVTFMMEPFETRVCRMAIIQDPEGNKITVHQRKPEQASDLIRSIRA